MNKTATERSPLCEKAARVMKYNERLDHLGIVAGVCQGVAGCGSYLTGRG